MKKKAFTLTELLVVVVIIGTLAAVVLPKFTKVLENRKTTEAEQLMAAVRNEQEARCTLDKNYTADTGKLASWPKNLGTNYNYELTASGISATSDKGYKLAIQSYRDGSICCSGDYCSKLGKSYPACSNEVVNTGCEASDLPDTPQPEESSDTPQPEEPCVPPAQTTQTDTRKCGCTSSGTKTGTRTFDMESCSWGDWSWGECTEQETDCTDECPDAKPATERDCGCGYKEQRLVKCDETTNYQWEIQTGSNIDGHGGSGGPDGWFGCAKPKNGATKVQECTGLQLGSDANGNWITAYENLVWSDDTCQWEANGCCEKHDNYSEDCPDGQPGKIWYKFNYNSCSYERSYDTCGQQAGTWKREVVESYAIKRGPCYSAGIPYYQDRQNAINTDEEYPRIEAQTRYGLPDCPVETHDGGPVPASFTGTMCYKHFSRQGRACPVFSTAMGEICDGMPHESNDMMGPYTDAMRDDGCVEMQTGSSSCPEGIGIRPVCIMPYTYVIYYRVVQ